MIPKLPETFTTSQAEQHGIARHQLPELARDGYIERVARGVYRRTDASLADADLLEVATRSPRATLCLVSALAHHELTDIIPPTHDIAVPRGTWKPLVSAPVTWHSFDKETFDAGRDHLQLDTDTHIGLYDAPRTIIDCYRLRNDVGIDNAHEALRRWLRQGGKPRALLARMETFPRTRNVIMPALQLLL